MEIESLVLILNKMERWQSGRMRSLGKRVRGQLLQGFESFLSAKNNMEYIESKYFSYADPDDPGIVN